MTQETRVDEMAAELQRMMVERLALPNVPFERQVAKAGRLLPRRQRRNAARLIEARSFGGHPKLARQIDLRTLEGIYRDMRTFLEQTEPGELRWTRRINLAAAIAFNLLVVGILIVLALVWTGTV